MQCKCCGKNFAQNGVNVIGALQIPITLALETDEQEEALEQANAMEAIWALVCPDHPHEPASVLAILVAYTCGTTLYVPVANN